MPEPVRCPFVLLGLKLLGHLRLKPLLNDGLQQRPKSILVVARQHCFPVESSRRCLAIGHGVFPFHGVGEVEHPHHAMAASASKLLQNLQHTIHLGLASGISVPSSYKRPSTAVPTHSISRCPGTAAGLAKA